MYRQFGPDLLRVSARPRVEDIDEAHREHAEKALVWEFTQTGFRALLPQEQSASASDGAMLVPLFGSLLLMMVCGALGLPWVLVFGAGLGGVAATARQRSSAPSVEGDPLLVRVAHDALVLGEHHFELATLHDAVFHDDQLHVLVGRQAWMSGEVPPRYEHAGRLLAAYLRRAAEQAHDHAQQARQVAAEARAELAALRDPQRNLSVWAPPDDR